jgi:hypothetical protein
MGRKTEAYVDTSAFIAFADRSDGYHALSVYSLPSCRRWSTSTRVGRRTVILV